MFVCVINKHGKPLMPCKPKKARLLLKQGKAKVAKRTPFTIQLLYGSSGYKQPVTLGVDTGYKNIGLSATTENEVLFEAEAELRSDIVELLATRRGFRKSRRNRKTRYRKPRFLNRHKPKGWLAPSVQNRIQNHLKLVKPAYSLMPITKIIVEVAQFDIQKIKNPNISGEEYQKGDQLGFWNVREYVLWRDNHKCRLCNGKSKDPRLNVHHLESRKIGGDSPDNLITLCETCHQEYHKGIKALTFIRGKSFKEATFMGVMRWSFYNKLKEQYSNVCLTYGYITKRTRITNHLKKSHRIDARCVSGNPQAQAPSEWFYIKQVRGQNRQLHKATIRKGGLRQTNKAPKYVYGYQLFDKVLYQGQVCFIFSRRLSGYFNLRLLDGTKIHQSAKVKYLKLLETAKTLLTERRRGDFPPV